MASAMDPTVYCSALLPTLSLDALLAAGQSGDDTLPFDVPAQFVAPEERLEEEEVEWAIQQFIDSLPPRQRTILERSFWQHESQASIARGLGVTRAAVSKAMANVCRLGQKRLAAYRHCCLLD